ncbi:MAG: hypothetical protein J6Y89_04930 [Lachnospiraceae bacterium]|nr:hypothetical protein [Lachnospiraceae bacterium]
MVNNIIAASYDIIRKTYLLMKPKIDLTGAVTGELYYCEITGEWLAVGFNIRREPFMIVNMTENYF